MSRIHEALKKSERERALREAKRSETQASEEQPSVEPVRSSSLLNPPPMPSFSRSAVVATPGNIDLMLEECVQHSWNPQSTMLFFNDLKAALGNEEFRTLRSRLFQMREQRPLRKVLVTSPLPDEGKSFVSANLAQVIACQKERRALLIDADLRCHHLHEALGTLATPGLSDYLLGEADEVKIMQRGPLPNLFFIPAGQTVSNPAELIANGRIKTLLNRSESLFDWVIIDSPPAIPVSDATLLADYCDGVLLVVRSTVTHPDAIRRTCQEFRENQLIGVILNGLAATSLPYYGSYKKPHS